MTDQQVIDQMENILKSKYFRNAKSLERFLRYVVMKRIAGEEHEVKEYTIGLEVFHRGDGYDPRTDAVVRVQANLLRRKLANYYQEEGAVDEIVIGLPKGHYVPRFNCRQSGRPASDNFLRLTNSRQRGFRWAGALRIAVAFAVGTLTALIFQHWWAETMAGDIGSVPQAIERMQKAIDPVYLPLWEKFLDPKASNVLAYGTPQFFVGNGVFLRDVEVNSAEEIVPGSRLMSIQKAFHTSLTPIEIYTGVGETHGVFLLSKFFWGASKELRVARSRLIGWNDLKSCNLVFLSSMRFHTLAKELPFQTDFVLSPGTDGHITNLRPQAGEEREYRRSLPSEAQYDHALITLWPGKAFNRRIMVLSGNTTWGTLAAAEYVTDPEHLGELNYHLARCKDKARQKAHHPYFQVLLRTEVRDAQPVATSYVTHHDLQIRDYGRMATNVISREP